MSATKCSSVRFTTATATASATCAVSRRSSTTSQGETPAVLEEMKRVAQFWLKDMGVDGFRLDAVRHLVEQGDQVSNTPGTHAVLRDYGSYVRSIAPNSYTIGEVWDSTGAILSYYPDQLDAYFAFPVSETLIEAVKSGKAGRLLAEVQRFQAAVPAYRWAPFQRNHDQTRTLTALGNDVAGAKLAATILLTLPGVPFVYYGEEIGMTGDKQIGRASCRERV